MGVMDAVVTYPKTLEDVGELVNTIKSLMINERTHELNDFYKGVIIASFEGDQVVCGSDCGILSEEDLGKLLRWVKDHKEGVKEYTATYYRLDFDEHILLFKLYKKGEECSIEGHLMEKNPMTRVALMDMKREYLASSAR
jgi:hypothetical protein